MKQLPDEAVVLIKARELIKEDKRFCRMQYYEDHGYYHAYCGLGAILEVLLPLGITSPAVSTEDFLVSAPYRQRLDKVAMEAYNQPFVQVNDDLGHSAALHCFDRAIWEITQEAAIEDESIS